MFDCAIVVLLFFSNCGSSFQLGSPAAISSIASHFLAYSLDIFSFGSAKISNGPKI